MQMETETTTTFLSMVDDDTDFSRQSSVANSGSTTLIFSVLFGVVLVDIILFNAVVLTTLISSKKLRALPCFPILVSLAVSDFLTGWTLTFYFISRQTFQTTPLAACKILLSVSSALVLTSINHCVVVAADRLYAVLSPFEYKTKKSSIRSVGILFGIWMVSAILPFIVFGTNSVRDIDNIAVCNPSFLLSDKAQIVSGLTLVYFLTAYAVICVMYTFVYAKLKSPFKPVSYTKRRILTLVHKRIAVDGDGVDGFFEDLERDSHALEMGFIGTSHLKSATKPVMTLKKFQNTGMQNERRTSISSLKKRKKIHTMLFITSGLMLLCFLPSMCCYCLRALGHESPTLDSSESWAYCMISINSAINPLLYAMRLPGFKKAFLKTFSLSNVDLKITAKLGITPTTKGHLYVAP